MICECWPLEPRLPVETYEAAAAARPTDNGPLQSLWETVLLLQLDSGPHKDPRCVVAEV